MSPVFRHGRLRLYLLKLLDEAPKHGYEVIRLLQDRFMGVYAPSPGTIYPRLARLEEEGLVTHDEVDGRKVYRLTDKGRAEIRERVDDLAELEEEITESVRDIAREVKEDVRETVRSLREEIARAARDVHREDRRPPHEEPHPRAWEEASREHEETPGRPRDEAQRARQEAGTGPTGRAKRPVGCVKRRVTAGTRTAARPGASRIRRGGSSEEARRERERGDEEARREREREHEEARREREEAAEPDAGNAIRTPERVGGTRSGRGPARRPARASGPGAPGPGGTGATGPACGTGRAGGTGRAEDWRDWPGSHDWPGTGRTPGWPDPARFRDLERVALQFASDLRRLAAHASAIGEDAFGDLRTILDEALGPDPDRDFRARAVTGQGRFPAAGRHQRTPERRRRRTTTRRRRRQPTSETTPPHHAGDDAAPGWGRAPPRFRVITGAPLDLKEQPGCRAALTDGPTVVGRPTG